MVTLRIRLACLGCAGRASFPCRDPVPDGDLLGSDEDVLDQQPEHALAFLDGARGGAGAELGEEAFQVVGELEVGLAVGELGIEGISLAAQVRTHTTITSGHPGVSQGRLTSPVSCSSSLHGMGDDAGERLRTPSSPY